MLMLLMMQVIGDMDQEDEVKRIRIVKSKSDKGERVMCEIWSSILKSQASLAKNKKARHGLWPAEVHGEETQLQVCQELAWQVQKTDVKRQL